MEKEVIERLTRMEERQIAHYEQMKPLIPLILKHDKDIDFGKKVLGMFGAVISAMGVWAATYFGSKH